MSARQSAENDALADLPMTGGHSYTEYGVLIDERSRGFGFRLAEVTRDPSKAEAVAKHYRELQPGDPVGVRHRRVHVTDWHVTSPAATHTHVGPAPFFADYVCTAPECPIPPGETR